MHDKRKDRCKDCGGSRLCKSPWCETHVESIKYEGYCFPCFVNDPRNHGKRVFRNYKTKEKDVVDKITKFFPQVTWITDKIIQDGCSSRRPDLLCDLGSHVLLVEIDENKHVSYDSICENKRVMEISRDLYHRPIVLIRFNPDEYITTRHDGTTRVKSCWTLNKLGVMHVPKDRQREWEERISTLKNHVMYWINHPSEKTIEIIKLFYS